MTKTTYRDDPEGNGIELYTESPEDGSWGMANGEYVTRRADGTLSDGREPLDVEALFSHLKDDDRLDVSMPSETRIGHFHLHVRDLNQAVDFYHGVVGFDVMGVAEPFRMAFFSAGGIHHPIWLKYLQDGGGSRPPRGGAWMWSLSFLLPGKARVLRRLPRMRSDCAALRSCYRLKPSLRAWWSTYKGGMFRLSRRSTVSSFAILLGIV